MTNPQPTSYSMSKKKNISLKIRNKTGMSAFTSLIQHSTGNPSHSNQTRKKIEGMQVGKEEVKLSLKADDMVHREPQRFHQETTRMAK